MRYTYKEGICSTCNGTYTGFISDEDPSRNICPSCQNPQKAVENAKTLSYKEFQPYFCKGLGVWIKSKSQRRLEMKLRGVEEVGEFKYPDELEVKVQEKEEPMTQEFMDVWKETVPREKSAPEVEQEMRMYG